MELEKPSRSVDTKAGGRTTGGGFRVEHHTRTKARIAATALVLVASIATAACGGASDTRDGADAELDAVQLRAISAQCAASGIPADACQCFTTELPARYQGRHLETLAESAGSTDPDEVNPENVGLVNECGRRLGYGDLVAASGSAPSSTQVASDPPAQIFEVHLDQLELRYFDAGIRSVPPDGPFICGSASVTNISQTQWLFYPGFELSSPDGVITGASRPMVFELDPKPLESATLAPGGKVSGEVCMRTTLEHGTFTVKYVGAGDPRPTGEWSVDL
jgi:hypothetical protein